MWYDKAIGFASGAGLATLDSELSRLKETNKGRAGWLATAQSMKKSARKGFLPWKSWNQEDPSGRFCLCPSTHN